MAEPFPNTILEHCPICGSKGFQKKLEVVDHSISKEKFTLEICTSCSLIFTNPRPSELSEYYKSEVYISHSATKKGSINRLYHLVQKQNIKQKLNAFKNHVPRGTWMDYGAGNGAFLEYLKEKNISAIGYEPDSDARSWIRDNTITITDSSDYKTNENQYAAITMWHVLEHIPDINEILEKHYSNLMDNGILVIAVPNHHSYDACYYKEHWAAYDVPRHLWHFTEKNVIDLMEKHSFEYLYTKPMIFDSYYVSMLSEKYKKGFLLRGALIGAISNIYARAVGYPFSSQIYVFRKKSI